MAEEEIVVLDTSVVIKWFSDEEYTEQALEIRSWYVDNRIGVFVPDFWCTNSPTLCGTTPTTTPRT